MTCIDISEDGHYLLAGYKKGTLVLWDSSKYKMAHIMKDVAKNETCEFTQVKLLFITETNVINIVTAEMSGRVRLVHVTKGGIFSSFSHRANSLYESDLKGVTSITVQRPSSDPYYQNRFCNSSCLTAYGATNLVTLVEMRQFPPRPKLTIKRPSFARTKSAPFMDWGYGLTPTNREKSVPILALAWDKFI